MKVFSSIHDFDYSWEEVSTANWRKYSPWNKESSHVIAVDTLSRRVDPATGILRTERLITCKQAAPKWLTPFLGGSEVSHVYEVSYVKPAPPSSAVPAQQQPPTWTTPAAQSSAPVVHMTSYNLTWSDLISVRETVVYTPCPDDPANKTRFMQHANITAMCGGWAKIREKIEGFTVERFGQNAERGRMGFEEVLEMSRKVFGEEKQREQTARIRDDRDGARL